MNDGLRTERSALPLAEAALRLGISTEALRLRVERGEAPGFDRNGEVFVYVNDAAAERRYRGSATDSPAAGSEPPVDGALPVVVEFQKMELTRLLRDNERLNARLDQLMDEIRHLRDMQQREQVLRQQEQSLRRQIQDTLDRLAGRLALPPPRPAAGETLTRPTPALKPEPAASRPELVLTRTVIAKKKPDPAKDRPGPQPNAAQLAAGHMGRRREPHAAMPKAAPGGRATPSLSAAPAPLENGGIAPEEAAELAVILKDIGQSLRDSEAFRRFPPMQPVPAPQRAGDRRPAEGPPGRAPSPRPVKEGAPADALLAEEEAMLAILDSMGPTAEDRRAAARRMRRLLRSRALPSRHEP